MQAITAHYDMAEEFISQNHSHDIPEIIPLSIIDGSETDLQ